MVSFNSLLSRSRPTAQLKDIIFAGLLINDPEPTCRCEWCVLPIFMVLNHFCSAISETILRDGCLAVSSSTRQMRKKRDLVPESGGGQTAQRHNIFFAPRCESLSFKLGACLMNCVIHLPCAHVLENAASAAQFVVAINDGFYPLFGCPLDALPRYRSQWDELQPRSCANRSSLEHFWGKPIRVSQLNALEGVLGRNCSSRKSASHCCKNSIKLTQHSVCSDRRWSKLIMIIATFESERPWGMAMSIARQYRCSRYDYPARTCIRNVGQHNVEKNIPCKKGRKKESHAKLVMCVPVGN